MAHVEIIEAGFSTADAEYPAITASEGRLELFNDWREESVRVAFHDVCAFKWQSAEELLSGEPYDGTCEVIGSEWIIEHVRQNVIPAQSGHRHLRFNFNAWGKLEVICTHFEVLTE